MQIRGRHLGFNTIAMVIMQRVALLVSFLTQITSIIVVFILLPFKYQIEHFTLCFKYANKKRPSWIFYLISLMISVHMHDFSP